LIAKENLMKNLKIATAIAALAIAVTMPVALAQTTPNADTSPPVNAQRSYEMGPSMMNGQGQGPGQAQSQGVSGTGLTMGPGQVAAGPGMMGGYGIGWMGGYGGIWVPILLVAGVGLVAWILMQKRK
jgi:uncharacterized membrane protein